MEIFGFSVMFGPPTYPLLSFTTNFQVKGIFGWGLTEPGRIVLSAGEEV